MTGVVLSCLVEVGGERLGHSRQTEVGQMRPELLIGRVLVDVENGNSSACANDGHAARQPDAARALGDDRGVLGEIDGCSVSV